MRSAALRSLVFGATSGLGSAYAGVTVPLSIGLSITQLPVQAVVVACVIVGGLVGWFAPTRRALVLIAIASGLASFAATRIAIALLYPPKLSG